MSSKPPESPNEPRKPDGTQENQSVASAEQKKGFALTPRTLKYIGAIAAGFLIAGPFGALAAGGAVWTLDRGDKPTNDQRNKQQKEKMQQEGEAPESPEHTTDRDKKAPNKKPVAPEPQQSTTPQVPPPPPPIDEESKQPTPPAPDESVDDVLIDEERAAHLQELGLDSDASFQDFMEAVSTNMKAVEDSQESSDEDKDAKMDAIARSAKALTGQDLLKEDEKDIKLNAETIAAMEKGFNERKQQPLTITPGGSNDDKNKQKQEKAQEPSKKTDSSEPQEEKSEGTSASSPMVRAAAQMMETLINRVKARRAKAKALKEKQQEQHKDIQKEKTKEPSIEKQAATSQQSPTPPPAPPSPGPTLNSLDLQTQQNLQTLGYGSDTDQLPSAKNLSADFRALAKLHHPDRGGDPAVFNEINQAYTALKANDLFQQQSDLPREETTAGKIEQQEEEDLRQTILSQDELKEGELAKEVFQKEEEAIDQQQQETEEENLRQTILSQDELKEGELAKEVFQEEEEAIDQQQQEEEEERETIGKTIAEDFVDEEGSKLFNEDKLAHQDQEPVQGTERGSDFNTDEHDADRESSDKANQVLQDPNLADEKHAKGIASALHIKPPIPESPIKKAAEPDSLLNDSENQQESPGMHGPGGNH